MGLGGGISSSNSSTNYSAITRTQNNILKDRESKFQSTFFPEFMTALNETKDDTLKSTAFSQAAAGINKAAAGGEKQLNQNLAQRGLAGMASGVEGSLVALQQNNKTNALADAYYKVNQDNTARRDSLLQMSLTGMSPTPTRDLGMTSKSSSTGVNGQIKFW
ncbi:MAG: hypothetical protein ACRC3H_12220 [Lachnospiraceae bacterium]